MGCKLCLRRRFGAKVAGIIDFHTGALELFDRGLQRDLRGIAYLDLNASAARDIGEARKNQQMPYVWHWSMMLCSR